MTKTISLAETLLRKGRSLRKLGASSQAVSVLASLTSFRNLPADVADAARRHLARLYCQRRQFRRARRLLSGATLNRADDLAAEYLSARAAAADVRCAPAQALRHFRRCLAHDPNNARVRSAFGVFALRNGREKLALRELRQAFRLAPTDRVVVRRYVRALQELRRLNEARRILRVCRFRLAGELWFENLLADFQFFVLHARQSRSRRRQRGNQGLCLLPFATPRLRLHAAVDGDLVRCDGPATLPATHLPLPLRRPDQRHAQ